jgi:hypothetical protein
VVLKHLLLLDLEGTPCRSKVREDLIVRLNFLSEIESKYVLFFLFSLSSLLLPVLVLDHGHRRSGQSRAAEGFAALE